MNTLVKKIASLLPQFEARGTVYLYALGEREDVERWDVILSSDWSDRDQIIAVKVVADALVERLEPAEFSALAGVMVIPSGEPNILDMPRSLESASPDEARIVDMTMMGSNIRRMFIFKAQPSHQAFVVVRARTGEELAASIREDN